MRRRHQLEPDDRSKQCSHEEYAPKGSWFFKYKNAEQCNANSPDACPYRIRGTQWNSIGGFIQQINTQHQADRETTKPQHEHVALRVLELSEAGGEADLEEGSK